MRYNILGLPTSNKEQLLILHPETKKTASDLIRVVDEKGPRGSCFYIYNICSLEFERFALSIFTIGQIIFFQLYHVANEGLKNHNYQGDINQFKPGFFSTFQWAHITKTKIKLNFMGPPN